MRKHANKQDVEDAAQLGAVNAIMCMIIDAAEKAAAIRTPVHAGSRLAVIAESARSIREEIVEAFDGT